MWITIVLSIIGFLVQYGPQLVALVQEIFSHLKHVKDPAKKEAFTAELQLGVTEFKRTGDKRPLLDLLKRVSDEVYASAS